MSNVVNEELVYRGMKKITNTADGSVREVPATWPGVLAMLLRRIIIDQYDGKGREGVLPEMDERLTYERLEDILEKRIQELNGGQLTEREVMTEKTRMMTEFARDGLSIKAFGDFLTIMGYEWVDLAIVVNRPSGTVKSYTTHIGGTGVTAYQRPTYNQEYFDAMGTHEEVIPKPANEILGKKAMKRQTKATTKRTTKKESK